MLLSKYVKIIKFKRDIVLCNTLNQSIVIIKKNCIENRLINIEKMKENDIKFLINNGFFSESLDKYKNIDSTKRDFITITINLTEKCNFSCKYCYQNNIFNNDTNILDNLDNIGKYIMELQSNGYNKFYIYFFGGEPLLKKEYILEIKKYLEEKIFNKNNLVNYGIGTNAYFLDEEFVSMFKHLNIDTTLTYEKDHNYLRANIKQEKTYETILNNLIKVQKKAKINLGYNVNHYNIKYFDEFLNDIKIKGLKNVKISFYYLENYDFNGFINKLNYEKFLEWKSSEAIDILIKHKYYVYGTPFYSYKINCDGYDNHSIKIFSDGNLGLCNATKFYNRRRIDFNINNVLEYKKSVVNLENSTKNNEYCEQCDLIGVCMGKIYCNDYKCKPENNFKLDLYLLKYIEHIKYGNKKYFMGM